MSRLTSTCLPAVLLGTCALVAYLATPAHPVGRAAPKTDPDQPPEVREIELSAIYSTSGQRKLVDVYQGLNERAPEWNEPSRIGEALRGAKSPPTLAIVRGESVKEAVLATARHVRLKKPPAGPIGPDDRSASKKYWLFVYLGSGHSGPLRWRVYPPTVYGTKVQFSYAKFEGYFLSDREDGAEIVTADDHAYQYWVPLGTFEDADRLKAELVEFTRKVTAVYPAAAKPKK